ncbi:hypothetical protein VQ042_22360 [Aurantimonas sp. A2-1-M11]|uniref:hypothetical protein n=1 Tax=Aurantimonas sp. A2-1-M11 TaxID=3113712 RepID=UPI002F930458
MKPIALVACAATLSACTTVNPQIPVPVSAQLARICQFEPLAHTAFVVLSQQAALLPQLIGAEWNAHLVVTRICADPPTDTATALAAASAAYADVLAAQSLAQQEI